MKRLFLQVYLLIMGSLLLAIVATEYFSNWFYAQEVESKYLGKSLMFTRAIQRDIAQGGNEAHSLAWWRRQLAQHAEIELDVIPREAGLRQAYVKHVAVTEAEDQLLIITPFDATRALRFQVHDRADAGVLWAYYGGYAAIYLLLAALLFALTHRVYRRIEAIRQQARRVADGDYGATLPAPRLAAFAALHQDLNRMTAALAEKTQANHLLTAAIHHELRTPLTRLRLALDMARSTPRPQEVPGLLHDMDGALDDLSQLMEDLLTLSRLRLSGQPAPRTQVDLAQLLAQCAARQGDARIQLQLVPCQLVANRALLERAFCNLIENACKYARQRVALTLAHEAGEITLTISDDGPGIPAADRAWVRQPFFRVERHRDRRTGGTGLGLAIADLALQDSGARWSIDASDWGGARFRLVWQDAGGAPQD